MTPEDKAWIEKIKKQYFPKVNKNPTSILDIPSFVGLEEEALFTAIKIIESQEKEIERMKKNQFVLLKPGVKYDENEFINYPVQFTQRQWDLISIALIKAQEIRSLPNSPFKEDWESLYKLSKERGSK